MKTNTLKRKVLMIIMIALFAIPVLAVPKPAYAISGLIHAIMKGTKEIVKINKDIFDEVEEIRKIAERERVLNKQTFMLIKEQLEKLRIENANWNSALFFANNMGSSLGLSYMHEMAAAMGTAGTPKNGEFKAVPIYNSEKYQYFEKLLAAHYPLAGDHLSLARGGVDPEYLAIDIADMKKRFDDMLLNGSDGTEIYTKKDDDEEGEKKNNKSKSEDDDDEDDEEEEARLSPDSKQIDERVAQNNTTPSAMTQQLLSEVITLQTELVDLKKKDGKQVEAKAELSPETMDQFRSAISMLLDKQEANISAKQGLVKVAYNDSPAAVQQDTIPEQSWITVAQATPKPSNSDTDENACEVSDDEIRQTSFEKLSEKYEDPLNCAMVDSMFQGTFVNSIDPTLASSVGLNYFTPDAKCLPSMNSQQAIRLFGKVDSDKLDAKFMEFRNDLDQEKIPEDVRAQVDSMPEFDPEKTSPDDTKYETAKIITELLEQSNTLVGNDPLSSFNVKAFPDIGKAKANAASREIVNAYLDDSCILLDNSDSAVNTMMELRRGMTNDAAFDMKVFSNYLDGDYDGDGKDDNLLGDMTESMKSVVDARMNSSKSLREDMRVLVEAVTNMYHLMELNTRASLKQGELEARIFDLDRDNQIFQRDENGNRYDLLSEYKKTASNGSPSEIQLVDPEKDLYRLTSGYIVSGEKLKSCGPKILETVSKAARVSALEQ